MLQKQNPKNKELILNMDGQLVHRDEAGVSPFDSAFQNGDTVWEGLRLYQGRIFRLQEHLDRMRKGATMLRYQGIPSDEKIINELRHTLKANDMTDNVHIRLVLSRGLKYTSGMDPRINIHGCSLFVLAEHKPPVYDRGGVRLITARQRRPFADILDQTIHSSNQVTSILAKMEAIEAGVDDALMLDPDGNMAETNATHVFIVKDGVIHTSTTKACPEGITRATVLELCEKHEIPHRIRDIPAAEVLLADEVFCTGTMGEIVPVVQLDDTIFNQEEEGPVTARVARLYTALTQSEGYQIIQEQ